MILPKELKIGDKIGIKKSSAQITKNYKIEQLLHKQIAAVLNFPKKQIGNLISEVLVLHERNWLRGNLMKAS